MIACIADSCESPFVWLCDALSQPVLYNPDKNTLKADRIFTDCIEYANLNWKTVFFCWQAKDIFFLNNSSILEVLAVSAILAKKMKSNGFKTKLQYPFIPEIKLKDKQYIGFNKKNELLDKIKNELNSYSFKLVNNIYDLNDVKIYIYFPDEEVSNFLIPAAQCCGITTITKPVGCIEELLSPYDININFNTYKEWINGVKTALRDYEKNMDNLFKHGKKWQSNLDVLAEKIKERTAKKAALKTIIPQPIEAIQKRISKELPKIIIPPVDNLPNFSSFYKEPLHYSLATPTWFNNSTEETCEVSVIIPMYRSYEDIRAQIRNWDLLDNTDHEIIYVNDACPQNSPIAVIETWDEVRKNYFQTTARYCGDFRKTIGKIVLLSHNSGYATACNVGAHYANGTYLLFLNADTVPTKNWIANLVHAIRNKPEVGIVGNLQLRQNGAVDSAGSEWMWDSCSFEHIGRNVYRGARLNKNMRYNSMPMDLMQTSERDMVTGCCFIIRKSFFLEIGGFDIAYRIGYWEDSDLNMETKSRGYKILYEPSSVIYHKSGHSGAGAHPFMRDNVKYFYKKWVENFRIDKLVKSKRPHE